MKWIVTAAAMLATLTPLASEGCTHTAPPGDGSGRPVGMPFAKQPKAGRVMEKRRLKAIPGISSEHWYLILDDTSTRANEHNSAEVSKKVYNACEVGDWWRPGKGCR
jgi:hypothetical protein